LVNFLTILNKYPNDLNAHYYGGLCYYNINNPTKALEFFDYILTHDHNAFYQEAQFYKALCLQRLGEYGKANFLLKKNCSAKTAFLQNKQRHFWRRRNNFIPSVGVIKNL
jgi:tetratricopeptide (TPR) repeat protein